MRHLGEWWVDNPNTNPYPRPGSKEWWLAEAAAARVAAVRRVAQRDAAAAADAAIAASGQQQQDEGGKEGKDEEEEEEEEAARRGAPTIHELTNLHRASRPWRPWAKDTSHDGGRFLVFTDNDDTHLSTLL